MTKIGGKAAIRPFDAADIAAVADLHREVNLDGRPMTDRLRRTYHDYLRTVFLENPWRRDDLPSLVHVSREGEIQGFLGVVPRTMMVNGETVTAAVSSQLVVAEQARASFAGLRLMRDFLAGAQDLAIADEANDKSRTLWTGLGGKVTHVHSVTWLRPLRPIAYLLTTESVTRRLRGFKPLARPVATALDAIAGRLLNGAGQSQAEGLSTRGLLGEELIAFMRRQTAENGRSAHAYYTSETIEWALGRAQRFASFGSLHTRMVTASDGTELGWYAVYANPGGVAEVLHMTARPGAEQDVLELLTDEARDGGAVALTGRCDAGFLPALADAHCLMHPTGRWVLLHSSKPELLDAFCDSNARLSRLDGEFVLRFDPEAASPAP